MKSAVAFIDACVTTDLNVVPELIEISLNTKRKDFEKKKTLHVLFFK